MSAPDQPWAARRLSRYLSPTLSGAARDRIASGAAAWDEKRGLGWLTVEW
jgi:hypothetical protein